MQGKAKTTDFWKKVAPRCKVIIRPLPDEIMKGPNGGKPTGPQQQAMNLHRQASMCAFEVRTHCEEAKEKEQRVMELTNFPSWAPDWLKSGQPAPPGSSLATVYGAGVWFRPCVVALHVPGL